MFEIGKLHHCTIVVANLEATHHFYVNVLGMEQVDRPKTFDFPGQWFRKNGYDIHTLHTSCTEQVAGDPPIPAGHLIPRTRHFCFSVNDMDATIAGLADLNVPIAAGPQPRGDGATQLYIYDPDGHLVELVHEPWSSLPSD